jgi:hypothetical protein
MLVVDKMRADLLRLLAKLSTAERENLGGLARVK